MTITRLLKNAEPSISATPSVERTISIPRSGTGDPYRDGCALHAELAGGPQRYRSVVGIIHREVRRLGGKTLRSEHSMRPWGGIPAGRADIIAFGTGETGVVEVKVVARLPENPRGRDAAQLGAYTRLKAHWSAQLAQTWAALIYVDLNSGQLRVFVFRDRELKTLVREAEDALAAA